VAEKYAGERVQFGAPIKRIPAVAALLADMRVALEASRAVLYEAARIVDLKEAIERRVELLASGELDPALPDELKELRAELKRYNRLAGLYTPLVKAHCTEVANRIAYDSLQVHGGSGYMRDFAVERHLRDARITTIYEGTTQLQVVAAIGPTLSGTLAEQLERYDGDSYAATPELLERVRKARTDLEWAIERVRAVDDSLFRDFHARRLVEMATDVVCGYLLLRDAQTGPRKLLVARHFVAAMAPRVAAAAQAVVESSPESLDTRGVIAD
jgi:hypothetical protein